MKKERNNAIIYTLSDFLAKGIPFLILPLVTYYLSPSDFGQLNIYLIYSEVILIIVMMGGNTYLRVNYFKYNGKIGNIISNGLFISLIITILVLFIILLFIEDKEQKELLLILTTSSFFQCFIVYNTTNYQCKQKASNVAIINLITTFSSSVLFVFFLYVGVGYQAKIFAIFLSVLFVTIYVLFCKDKINICEAKLSITDMKNILIFGIGIFPHAISWWARPAIDRIVINDYLSLDAVGIYSLAFQLSIPIFILINALNQAFNPKIYHFLNDKKKKEAEKLAIRLVVGIVIISIIYSAVIYLIFNHIYNVNYSYARSLTSMLILALSIQSIIIIYSNFMYFYGKQLFLSIVTFSSCIIHIVITYVIINYYNYDYIYISYFMSLSFSALLIMWKLKKVNYCE